MSFRTNVLALPLLSLVAGCVAPIEPPPQQPAPRATPKPTPTPMPPPSADATWRYLPVTPGVWSYRSGAATFGSASGPKLTLRCDRAARRVAIALPNASTLPLTVRTSSTARTVSVAQTPDGTPAATLAASDPLLDAMAFSRGRFAVAQQGSPALALPVWAEIGRVIEDCRS